MAAFGFGGDYCVFEMMTVFFSYLLVVTGIQKDFVMFHIQRVSCAVRQLVENRKRD